MSVHILEKSRWRGIKNYLIQYYSKEKQLNKNYSQYSIAWWKRSLMEKKEVLNAVCIAMGCETTYKNLKMRTDFSASPQLPHKPEESEQLH